jgi:endogenous inhibitor of DNA gyrase (YacG/DUF329 family)
MTDEKGPAADAEVKASLCVICGVRPQTEQYRPFCSKRCADVDLNRWLGGVYAIAGEDDAEEDETPPPSPSGRLESG